MPVQNNATGPYKLIGSKATGVINTGIKTLARAVEEAKTYASRSGVDVAIKDSNGVEVERISP